MDTYTTPMIITALITDITIPTPGISARILVANGTYEDDDWMASQVWGQITYEIERLMRRTTTQYKYVDENGDTQNFGAATTMSGTEIYCDMDDLENLNEPDRDQPG